MARRFAICLAIVSLLFVAPRPAAAAYQYVFDTVDAVELTNYSTHMKVTGVLTGQTVPTSVDIYLYTGDVGARCERLALLVLSKPGKYQFHISDGSSSAPGCKMVRRVP